MFYHAIVPYFRAERFVGFWAGECGNGRQQLHGRSRTGKFLRTIVIKRFLSRQVVDGYADFGCFGEHLLDKRIYPGEVLLPPKWQQTNRKGD